ncbi:MAG: ABC transporter permease [Acidimicrobiales bacterium]
MTSTMSTPAPPTAEYAGYSAALSSEWTKFHSVRAPGVVTLVLLAIYPLMALIVAATESLEPDDTILGASVLGGAVLAQVLAAVMGANLVTSEFRTGSIQSTLLACPRRLTLLGAKASIAAGVVAVTTAIGTGAAFAVGLAMLDRETYRTGDLFPAVLGVVAAMGSVAVLGLAIGTIVRHPAGAVTAVVAVAMLPGVVAPMLGDGQRWVGGASLDGVLQKLIQSSDATPETVGSLGAWPSLSVVVAYTAAAVVLGLWTLRRRDL